MPYYFYYDPTYMLVIVGLIITLIASANVNGTFRKYDKISSRRGITAAQAARRILDANGLQDIRIERAKRAKEQEVGDEDTASDNIKDFLKAMNPTQEDIDALFSEEEAQDGEETEETGEI